jgi:hypothetical protein
MQKVILNRFWVMSGRWRLMSLHNDAGRPGLVAPAWFRSIYAPYWRGRGVALTLGPWSLRFGRCRPGMEMDESEDDFDWGDLGPNFDEHLEASLFEEGPSIPVDVAERGTAEVELVTAFVDTRTNQLTAIVHTGGEVEYVEQKVVPLGQVPDPT